MYDRDELLGRVALLARELHELPRTGSHRPSLRSTAHSDTETTPELEQTFITHRAQRTQNGVRVHAHHSGEVVCWRKPLPWLCLALGDRTTDLRGDLVMQRRWVRSVDTIQHCAIHVSIIVINGSGVAACL